MLVILILEDILKNKICSVILLLVRVLIIQNILWNIYLYCTYILLGVALAFNSSQRLIITYK